MKWLYRRNILWVLGILCLLLLASAALLSRAPSEPSFEGRTLTQWIEYGARESDEHMYESRRAISAMGAQALPCLLQWIGSKPSDIKGRINDLLDAQSVVQFRFQDSTSEKHRLAVAGFAYLGPSAVAATQTLAKLLKEDALPNDAAAALAYIGKPAVPILFDSIKKGSEDLRGEAFSSLIHGYLLHDPEVFNCVTAMVWDANPDIQGQATYCLSQVEVRPEIIAPLFEEIFWSIGHPGRATAIQTLASWPTNIATFLPVFVSGISDTNMFIRTKALQGLSRIQTTNTLPYLEQFLDDPEPELRAKGYVAVGKLTNSLTSILRRLQAGLDDPHPLVRFAAMGRLTLLATAQGHAATQFLRETKRQHYSTASESTRQIISELWNIDRDAAQALGATFQPLDCGGWNWSYIPAKLVQERVNRGIE